MIRIGDIIGLREVVEYVGIKAGQHRFRVRCQCGKESVLQARSLVHTRLCNACATAESRQRPSFPRLPVWREWGDEMPETRAGCMGRPRPCPWFSCKHHLIFEASGGGKLNGSAEHKADELFDYFAENNLPSCALDAADLGGLTLEEVGLIMRLTREWIRQLETAAMRRYRANARGRMDES